MRPICWFLLFLVVGPVYVAAQPFSKLKHKRVTYEEVDFEDMMRRYFGKEQSSPLEGIYSVSCVITEKSKVFLSKRERFRVVGRRDNYARVAIIKDWPGAKRDYIEVSLSYHDAKKYPIMGELNALAEGKGFIYKHVEPDGTDFSFSMVNESAELLEAEYSDMQKRKTVTYKLSYLKTYPKLPDYTVYKN
jgi:hypothetical protein